MDTEWALKICHPAPTLCHYVTALVVQSQRVQLSDMCVCSTCAVLVLCGQTMPEYNT